MDVTQKRKFQVTYAEFMKCITCSEAQEPKQVLKNLQWKALILWKEKKKK